jgi:hypothetical protein
MYKIYFFLDSFIHFRIFKQVPKYSVTGLQRPSGTCSPPAEASTQGLKCKTNTIPDAHFEYSSLFSGTQAEKVGNPEKNCENCIKSQKTQKLSQIAMHEGDNPDYNVTDP